MVGHDWLVVNRIIICLSLLFSTPLIAFGDFSEDVKTQTRLSHLYRQIKCPVCQGQSIEDSQAEMAHTMRTEVRFLVAKGLTDQEIRDTMVQHYGEEILLKPTFSKHNLVLWLTPLLILSLLVILGWRRFRHRL